MRFGLRMRWMVAGGIVLGLTGSAVAQPAGPSGANGQVGFERKVGLSPQEELQDADATVTKMDQSAATIRRQLDGARQGRDVVRSLCLSDKLSQIDVATRSARDRQGALQSAVQRNDAELANHEFTILTVLRQRSEQLTAEANQCIGEEVAFVSQTSVVSVVDPNLPADDVTTYPPSEATGLPSGGSQSSGTTPIVPPPSASPTN